MCLVFCQALNSNEMLNLFSRRDIFRPHLFYFSTKKNLLFLSILTQAILCPVSAGMTGILQWDAGPPARDYDSVSVTSSGKTTLTLIVKGPSSHIRIALQRV
jgi:hypothetical protein